MPLNEDLVKAITEGSVESIRDILSRGGAACFEFEHDACYASVSPLHVAVHHGVAAVVEMLLNQPGVVVDLVPIGVFSSTPLVLAAHRGAEDIVQLLLTRGADPHLRCRRGRLPAHTALEAAAEANHAGVVRLLLSAGADANDGALFEAAARSDSAPVVRMLVAAGADVNAVRSDGLTPLMLAVAAAGGSFAVVLALIESGADLDAVRGDGATALHAAVSDKKFYVSRLLVACGARLDLRDHAGCTAVDLCRHKELACVLFAAGAPRGRCRFDPDVLAARVAHEAKQLRGARCRLIRDRAFVVCLALQELELPALVTLQIIDDDPLANCVPMHVKWAWIVRVKHLRG